MWMLGLKGLSHTFRTFPIVHLLEGVHLIEVCENCLLEGVCLIGGPLNRGFTVSY